MGLQLLSIHNCRLSLIHDIRAFTLSLAPITYYVEISVIIRISRLDIRTRKIS